MEEEDSGGLPPDVKQKRGAEEMGAMTTALTVDVGSIGSEGIVEVPRGAELVNVHMAMPRLEISQQQVQMHGELHVVYAYNEKEAGDETDVYQVDFKIVRDDMKCRVPDGAQLVTVILQERGWLIDRDEEKEEMIVANYAVYAKKLE